MRGLQPCLLLLVPTLTVAYDFTCNLFCYNGGECRHGKGKFGNYKGVHEDEVMPWEKDIEEASMFCSCPVGYTGLQCEIKHIVCGEDEGTDSYTCFNGSSCVKERSGNGDLYWRCECDPDNSIMTAKYAGKYCEHIATTFCTGDKDGSSTSYCTNGGRCKEKTTPDQLFVGCICPDDWTGSHCQFPVNTADTDDFYTLNYATSKTNVARLVGFLILTVCGGTFILFCCDKHKKRREKRRRRRTDALAANTDTSGTSGGSGSFFGNSGGGGDYEMNPSSTYRDAGSSYREKARNNTYKDEESSGLIMA